MKNATVYKGMLHTEDPCTYIYIEVSFLNKHAVNNKAPYTNAVHTIHVLLIV